MAEFTIFTTEVKICAGESGKICGNNEMIPKESINFHVKDLQLSECLFFAADGRSYFCPNEREL